MIKHITLFLLSILLITCFQSIGCDKGIIIEGEEITIEFDQNLHSRVISNIDGETINLGDIGASEYIQEGANLWTIFPFKSQKTSRVDDQIGKGTLYTILGESELFRKTINATVYEDFPKMVLYSITYENLSNKTLQIENWTNNRFQITSDLDQKRKEFWSFQTGSYDNWPDWILTVSPGFKQDNYLGMNGPDYGGRIPVSDVWREDIGLAIGHLEKKPALVSLPVEMSDSRGAFLRITKKENQELQSGESFTTLQTFVSVHKGDCFESLTTYHKMMANK